MWERFSSSGLEGSYVDELSKAGVRAAMEFRPRRALDPYPFLVRSADEGEGEAFFTRPINAARGGSLFRFVP